MHILKGWFDLPKSSFGMGKCSKWRLSKKKGTSFRRLHHMMLFCNHLANEPYLVRFRSIFFKGPSALFRLRIVEKYLENAFGTVRSFFQNLRLGSMNLLQKNRRCCSFLQSIILQTCYKSSYHHDIMRCAGFMGRYYLL